MRKIVVVGKVDSRALVYPMARSLALNGMTVIITDDGAYRRLYHGKGNFGVVSGVDIVVSNQIDDNYMDLIKDTGLTYENVIVVTNDFIPSDADGIVVCHGVDRSILQVEIEEEGDKFILPPLIDSNIDKDDKTDGDEDDEINKSVKSSKKKRGKLKDTDEQVDNIIEENKESNNNCETNEDVSGVIEESDNWHTRAIKEQQENPDKIIVPDDKTVVEVQIAYVAVPKKSNIIGISLKDGIVNYMYSCEEKKELCEVLDKNFESIVNKVTSTVSGIGNKELNVLMHKEEGVGAPSKKKKKTK